MNTKTTLKRGASFLTHSLGEAEDSRAAPVPGLTSHWPLLARCSPWGSSTTQKLMVRYFSLVLPRIVWAHLAPELFFSCGIPRKMFKMSWFLCPCPCSLEPPALLSPTSPDSPCHLLSTDSALGIDSIKLLSLTILSSGD